MTVDSLERRRPRELVFADNLSSVPVVLEILG